MALGYSIGILGAVAFIALRIVVRLTGYGSWALVMLKGMVFSFNKTSIIWVIPELIQIAILGFIAGYLIAIIYNKTL